MWRLTMLTAAVMAGFSCGGPAAGGGEDRNVAPPSPGSLVIFSAASRGEGFVAALVEQFQDATGINVTVKYGDAFELADVLQKQLGAADLFYTQDLGGLGGVTRLLSPLPADMLQRVPAWARFPGGQWIGLTARVRASAYNPAKVRESDLPRSAEGFVEPKWKGRLGWAPSNISFQSMITAMRLIWGEEKTASWLKGIQANQPKVFSGNSALIGGIDAGEIDVALVNHSQAMRLGFSAGEDFKPRNHFFSDGGPGQMLVISGASILEGTKNRDNALKFINFMLSKVAQQYMAFLNFEYPLVEGVVTARGLKPLAEVLPKEIDQLNMEKVSDLDGSRKMLTELGILK